MSVYVKKNNSFNALRFFFCVIVIIGHCLDLSGISKVINWRYLFDMHVSVCAFFIISGFFVTLSYLHTDGVKKFYFKRIKRILPPYWLIVILCSLIFFFFASLSVKEYFLNKTFFKYLVTNLLTLNFLCVSPVGKGGGYFFNRPVDGALWTIKIELTFYLVLPVIVFFLNKIKKISRKNIFLVILYFLSVLWNLFFLFLGNKHHSGFLIDLAHQFPGFLSFFVAGMFYAYNYDAVHKYENIILIPAIIIFALHYFTKTEILMPASFAVIIMYFGSKSTVFSNVGKDVDYSYGMYLSHFPIIQIFTYLGFFTIAPVLSVVLVFAASFSFAYLSWHLLERKILKK